MQRIAVAQRGDHLGELEQRARCTQPEPEVMHQSVVAALPEFGHRPVAFDQGGAHPLLLVLVRAGRGDGHHADPQPPTGRLGNQLSAGSTDPSADLGHAPQPSVHSVEVDVIENFGNGNQRPFYFRTLLVVGNVHQHIRLVVGLVLPDPLEDRGVGELPPGRAFHSVRYPFEGEVVRCCLDPLLLEDGPVGVQHELAQFTLEFPLPGAARRGR